MKKFGLISVVAGALTAATIGLAGPALADGNGSAAGGHHGHYGYAYGYGDNDYPGSISFSRQ